MKENEERRREKIEEEGTAEKLVRDVEYSEYERRRGAIHRCIPRSPSGPPLLHRLAEASICSSGREDSEVIATPFPAASGRTGGLRNARERGRCNGISPPCSKRE